MERQPLNSDISETAAIRDLIEQRLRARPPAALLPGAHPDEDTICAFVESRFAESEAYPIISHLVACDRCRQRTAQLIRFESEFEDEPDVTVPEQAPGRIRQLLDRVASGLIPSFSEDAVFAYQSPEDESEQETPDETHTVESPVTSEDAD